MVRAKKGDEFLKIEVARSGYTPTQCEKTLTVRELIEILEGYEDDTPVYLSNDNGYTYGHISEEDIAIDYCEEE